MAATKKKVPVKDGKAATPAEQDPNGKSQHSAGAKLDAGKVRPALVEAGFPRALLAVAQVGSKGAEKYTEFGFLTVPNGIARYDDAQARHRLARLCGEKFDQELQVLHRAQEAWNALAALELVILEIEKQQIKTSYEDIRFRETSLATYETVIIGGGK